MEDLTELDIRDIFEGIEFSDSNNNSIDKIDDDKNAKPKMTELICKSCDTNEYIFEDITNGFMVCKNCGQVLENLIDQNPERHNYDNESADVRSSAPINKLLPQSSLSTQISGGHFKCRVRQLQEWNAMPYRERSLSYVFKELHEKCKKANLIKCIEDDAKIMYKTISECKHTKGKNKDKYIIIRGANRKSLIAACIFFACRRKNMTRSPKEIADLFEIKFTDMTKGCKNFMKLMKLKQKGMTVGTSQPEDFILRFCNELKLKQVHSNQALQIAKNIRKLSLASDHTPPSIATCSILLMAEINKIHHITKRKLSNNFDVSEVTITKGYKKIEQLKNILTDDNLTDKMILDISVKNNNNVMSDKLKERFKKYNITIEDKESTNKKDDEGLDEYVIKNEDIDEDDILEELESDEMETNIDETIFMFDPRIVTLFDNIKKKEEEYKNIIKRIKTSKYLSL